MRGDGPGPRGTKVPGPRRARARGAEVRKTRRTGGLTCGVPPSEESPIRVFLSYAQDDDHVLGFIGPFTRALEQFAFSDRGRRVEVFVDRTDLVWGQEWRSGIDQAIDSAPVFLPLITNLYFDRPYCRKELHRFHSEADRRGVPSLLLPVVLLGHRMLTPDHEDPLVRVISERQYRDLREAMLEGSGSAVWRRAVLALAGDLVDVVEEAERVLATAPPAPSADEDPLLGAFRERHRAVGALLAEVRTALSAELVAVERASVRPSVEAQRTALGVASALRVLGERFSDGCRDYEAAVAGALAPERRAGAAALADEVAALWADERAVSDLLDRFRPLEEEYAPLRHTLRTLRRGCKSLQTALLLVERGAG